MYPVMAGRSVPDGAGHLIVLVMVVGALSCREPNARADPVAIAARPFDAQGDPVIALGAHILPKLRRAAQRGYDRINLAVVVEVGEGGATVRARRLEVGTGGGGHVLERPVAEAHENAVRLAVMVHGKPFDVVGDVRIRREHVLPAVVVQVDEAHAPAAAPGARETNAARISFVAKGALALVAGQRQSHPR